MLSKACHQSDAFIGGPLSECQHVLLNGPPLRAIGWQLMETHQRQVVIPHLLSGQVIDLPDLLAKQEVGLRDCVEVLRVQLSKASSLRPFTRGRNYRPFREELPEQHVELVAMLKEIQLELRMRNLRLSVGYARGDEADDQRDEGGWQALD